MLGQQNFVQQMAGMLADPSMIFMHNVTQAYHSGVKKRYRGQKGEDWEQVVRFWADQANLARYTQFQELQDGKNIPKQDFSRLLTILTNFFPEQSKAQGLVERNKTSFERFMKDFPSAQADVQGLYASLLASLRRLSKADDTFWWWTKFLKEWVPDTTKGDIDAIANLWELDTMFDTLQETIAKHAEVHGGHLKPSTLEQIPIDQPWVETLRALGAQNLTADLSCGEGDDPTQVLKAVQATCQVELQDVNERLADNQDKVDQMNANPPSLSAEEFTSLQELIDRKKEVEHLQNQLATVEVEVQEQYLAYKEEIFQGRNRVEFRRKPTTYSGVSIPEGDLRLLHFTPKDRVKLFLARAPKAWANWLKALRVPLETMDDVERAILVLVTVASE